MRRCSRRAGFTLLEVLLAGAITLLMMAALYAAMDVQIRQMEEGRGRIDRGTIARGLFNRLSNDLKPSLSPVLGPPSSSSSSSGTGTGGGAGSGGAGGGAGAGAGAGAEGAGGGTGMGGATDVNTTVDESETFSASTTPVKFHIGVVGDSAQVTIFQTRLTRSVINPRDDGTGGQDSYASDIRRISYFQAGGGTGGLARQEIRLVTSDAVDSLPMDVDEDSRIIAPEVTEFEVRYFDGASWQSSWNGADLGPDGKTALGPPRAIEIILTIAVEGFDEPKTFRHVIAFPAAPGESSGTTSE